MQLAPWTYNAGDWLSAMQGGSTAGIQQQAHLAQQGNANANLQLERDRLKELRRRNDLMNQFKEAELTKRERDLELRHQDAASRLAETTRANDLIHSARLGEIGAREAAIKSQSETAANRLELDKVKASAPKSPLGKHMFDYNQAIEEGAPDEVLEQFKQQGEKLTGGSSGGGPIKYEMTPSGQVLAYRENSKQILKLDDPKKALAAKVAFDELHSANTAYQRAVESGATPDQLLPLLNDKARAKRALDKIYTTPDVAPPVTPASPLPPTGSTPVPPGWHAPMALPNQSPASPPMGMQATTDLSSGGSKLTKEQAMPYVRQALKELGQKATNEEITRRAQELIQADTKQ
jgi:hypothetical protein